MSAFNPRRTCRMACIARLLEDENLPEISPDEETSRNIVVQSIHRQILDAVEPNLLDEEDIHVFGSSPLTDPLYLVQCNFCKKHIKSSHIAAHKDRCALINGCKDASPEIDGATHVRKPQKKRRKLQATNGRVKGKSDVADAANYVGLEINNQDSMLRSSSVESASPQASADHGRIPIATEVRLKSAKYSDAAWKQMFFWINDEKLYSLYGPEEGFSPKIDQLLAFVSYAHSEQSGQMRCRIHIHSKK